MNREPKMNSIKRIQGLLLSLALLLSVTACFQQNEEKNTPPKYVIQPVALSEHVEIHTAEQLAYLNDTYDSIADHVPSIAKTERSHPQEITLSWLVTGNEMSAALAYQVSISTSPAMENATVYTTAESSYSIYNLYIGTTYYWTVSFAEDGVTYTSEVASFTTTDQGPRNLKIDGVTNCRDAGGWKTKDGRTVKQGMLFRTAKIDEITEAGKKTMLEELGVKTEIDLRGSTKESLLEGVKVLNYTCGSNASLQDLKPALPDLFLALADESNYPIFYHCQIGTDRTGALAFLINALLGVEEKDLYYDYCFSNFGALCAENETSFTIRTPQYLQNKVHFHLKRTPGNTLQEQVRNYLKSLGITDATLDAVARILLE